MQKRYGVAMNIYGHILPGAARLSRQTIVLSAAAKQRLKWMDWYCSHGQNARATCRHFGLSPDVFYRWKNRYNSRDLSSLEDDVHDGDLLDNRPCTCAYCSGLKLFSESCGRRSL